MFVLKLKYLYISLLAFIFLGCAGSIIPNPSGIRPSAQVKKEEPKEETVVNTEKLFSEKEEGLSGFVTQNDDTLPAEEKDVLDFGDVFEDDFSEEEKSETIVKNFEVPVKTVRVQLFKNRSKLSGFLKGTAPVVYKNQKSSYSLKGKIRILAGGPRGTLRLETSTAKYLAYMPCTLSSVSSNTQFTFGSNNYSGAVIITKGKGTAFNVINYLPVEEYLRGVVPLELGQRDKKLIEAVKAQAVAARTYTYMKIAASKRHG